MSQIQNLDLQCAQAGQAIAERVGDESLIQRLLGVLQEEGIYAFFLYSFDKSSSVIEEAGNLIGIDLKKGDANQLSSKLTPIVTDIDRLFLYKQMIERALIYARYHCKASEEK
jgi:hypothetical protein